LQAGVGSFASAGIYYYLKKFGKQRPKIVIVEPTETDGIFYSLQEGTVKTSKCTCNTIMAGLNCATPSTTGFEII